jgi:hypothetical protein
VKVYPVHSVPDMGEVLQFLEEREKVNG